MKNFTVDPQTGELTVKDRLDREVLVDENYGMTIQVCLSGMRGRGTTGTVRERRKIAGEK